jgi:thiol-disulfide isomerase/thioredoxin
MRVLAVAALAVALASGAATAAGAPAGFFELPLRRGTAAPQPLRAVVGSDRVVVTFWASYCAPCRAEVPTLNAAAKQWASRGVRIVGVAVDLGNAAEVDDVAREWGIDYDTWWIHPGAQEAAQRLMPDGLPTTFFVWNDLVVRHSSFLTADALEALITRHLGSARPEPTPAAEAPYGVTPSRALAR